MKAATQNEPYNPLDPDKTEIRILYVDGFTDGTPYGYETQCATGRLVHISLAEKHHIPFYALSYVWGDPAPVSSIILDSGAQISIAHNLLEGLEHITKYGFLPVNVPIWIDAACINQTDDLEKSSQVAQMARIYSESQKTLIFLGPADDDSGLILDVMNRVGSSVSKTGSFSYWNQRSFDRIFEDHTQQQRTILRHIYNRTIGHMRRHGFCRRLKKVATKSDLKALVDVESQPLMCEPWWTRVWVLQELLLSRSPYFIYGSRIIDADDLQFVFRFLHIARSYYSRIVQYDLALRTRARELLETIRDLDLFHVPAIALCLHKEKQSGSAVGWPLGLVLSVTTLPQSLVTRGLRTSQPIDQIYGILGLVTWPEGQARILPDYSLKPVDVFAKATIAVLETTPRPSFTYLRRATYPKKIHELSSWTCDWTDDMNTPAMGPMWYHYSRVTSILPYKISQDGQHLLTLHGSFYGFLSAVGTRPHLHATLNHVPDQQQDARKALVWLYERFSPFWNGLEGSEETREGVSLQDECELTALIILGRPLREALFALQAGSDLSGLGLSDYDIEKHIQDLPIYSVRMTERLRPTLESMRHGNLITEVDEWLLKELRDMWSREADLEDTLIMMDNAILGLAQSTVHEGDLVVKFDLDQGIHFIIRPVEDSMYKLVSMAWIPGLMRDPITEGERREFVLC